MIHAAGNTLSFMLFVSVRKFDCGHPQGKDFLTSPAADYSERLRAAEKWRERKHPIHGN
jgi:hypothetical protein